MTWEKSDLGNLPAPDKRTGILANTDYPILSFLHHIEIRVLSCFYNREYTIGFLVHKYIERIVAM